MKYLKSVLVAIPFLLILFVGLIVAPPAWLASSYDLVFMSKFESSEGGFSINLPKRWKISGMQNTKPRPFLYHVQPLSEAPYLEAWYTGYLRKRVSYYALIRIYKITRTYENIPTAGQLAEDLSNKLAMRQWVISEQFEIKRFRGLEWAVTTQILSGKSTATARKEIRICWQTVGNITKDHYIVMFYTDRISNYKAVFDKIFQSFSFI